MQQLKGSLTVWLVGMLATTAVHSYDIDQHAWRDRLLILAAPERQHPTLTLQQQTVAARAAAIADRRLRVFVLAGGAGQLDGSPLSVDDVVFLRRTFAIEANDTVMLLVGLDGQVKRRDALDTALSELFIEVDAMPMRRAEIRAKRAAGETVTEP
ncbi:MAG: DUF4174 domain-containing protein [Chromatiaceae bacterium]